jgi:hypothetical protein
MERNVESSVEDNSGRNPFLLTTKEVLMRLREWWIPTIALGVAGMAVVVAGQDKGKAAEKREKLVLQIPPRPIWSALPTLPGKRPRGRVTLEVEKVERDKDGRITAVTVCRQTVKVDHSEEIEQIVEAKEELQRRLEGLMPQPPRDALDPPRPFYEVDDPVKGPNTNFPNPPGADLIRAALNRYKPVPDDRIAYFAPLLQKHPHSGWWLYVDRVKRHGDGFYADVAAHVKLGPGGSRVSGFWMERYWLYKDTLTYIGGHFEPPMEAFRVPSISDGKW